MATSQYSRSSVKIHQLFVIIPSLEDWRKARPFLIFFSQSSHYPHYSPIIRSSSPAERHKFLWLTWHMCDKILLPKIKKHEQINCHGTAAGTSGLRKWCQFWRSIWTQSLGIIWRFVISSGSRMVESLLIILFKGIHSHGLWFYV